MVNALSQVESRLELFLKQNGVASRSGATAGILMTLPLPLCVLKADLKLLDEPRLWLPLSFGLLLHSILNIVYLKRNTPIYTGLAFAPAVVITLITSYFSFNQGLIWKALVGISLLLVYEYGILNLMRVCPKAFTYGEACVVSQGISLFIASCFSIPNNNTCLGTSTIILKVGICSVVIIAAIAFTLDLGCRPVCFYALVVAVFGALLIPILSALISVNPLLWIFNLVTSDPQTVVLFGSWVGWSVMGSVAVMYQVHAQEKASTVMRKTFHILTFFVYLPGLLLNTCLMYLSSGIVFAVFIMIDVIRLLKVGVVSEALQEGFKVFSDGKDAGGLSLTPLYLVAGCSMPLWLHPIPSPVHLLPLASGLITVAVGDTAASVCGSLFGRNKWRGTNKTKEGTVACFISQLFFVIALIHFGYLPRKDLIRPVLGLSVASLVEARTSQVDNLVLPLLMYLIVV